LAPEIIEQLPIDTSARAEEISLAQYVETSNLLDALQPELLIPASENVKPKKIKSPKSEKYKNTHDENMNKHDE
jgi:hypothetical protein